MERHTSGGDASNAKYLAEPFRHEKAPEQQTTGRECPCGAKLSIYNPNKSCGPCRSRDINHGREKRDKSTQLHGGVKKSDD